MKTIISILLMAAALAFATPPAAGSAGAAETMTVEIAGRAILVRAPQPVIEDIRSIRDSLPEDISTAADFIEIIERRYGGEVHYEVFKTPGMSDFSEYEKTEINVREAVLRGIIPPVEGLDNAAAAKVLNRFGFGAFKHDEIDTMDDESRARMFYLADETIIVFTDTAPFSKIVIYEMPK